MDLINKYLGEAQSFVKKGIFSEEGRKVNLERSAKWVLSAVDKDNNVTPLNWKEYKNLQLPDNLNDYVKDGFVKSLLSQIKKFGTKVDFNSFSRKNPSFEEKVDWLLKNGAKYTKSGIKHV